MSVLLGDTRVLFTLFVGVVALQRLVEVVFSTRNARRLLAGGGVEAGQGHLPAMIGLHAAFLVAAPAEVWLTDRPFVPWLFVATLVALVPVLALRAWTLGTLGRRWCVRVIAIPGETPVVSGPFRWLRHPNYVVVAAEIALIPLLHAAFVTCVLFSVLNAWLLAVRIRAEERLLTEVAGYDTAMAGTPRFVPGLARRSGG